jgi:uncharacterized protein YbgA (DUF1722 family)/uncharacterized protein YbbK (DUF523 family)
MERVAALGVSSCLAGEAVRYDGGHKLDRFVTDQLGRWFRLVPVCPETGCGLPVPREPMRLEGDPASPRLVTVRTRIDLTDRMDAWCAEEVSRLEQEDLCGFIFKKGSPSSGLYRVKVYGRPGEPPRSGRGLFAAAVARRFPRLPLEEEGRLLDPAIRENFIERVFTYRRWKDFLRDDVSPAGLVAFHTEHKLLVMAHSPDHYRRLGRLVAAAGAADRTALPDRYEELLLEAMSRHATVSKHTNVLQHIMGYFRKRLTAAEKQELLEIVGRYHNRLVPLIVPVTLLKHYARIHEEPYLSRQRYLDPHPAELMLRNHV